MAVTKQASHAIRIADCDSGPGYRMTVGINSEGTYVTSFYSTREPKEPASPRESRAPRARPSITKPKGRS